MTFFDPFGPAERTVFVFVDPFDDAVKMESVFAFSDYGYAVIAWKLALWTGRLKGLLANRTLIIITYIPYPSGYPIPTQYFHFHLINI